MMEVDGKKKERYEEDVSSAEDTCEPCERRNVITKAAGLCRECEEYMCQLCFDHHLRARICMNHMLVDDIESSAPEVEDVEKCKQHENEVVKYYCRTHDTVGCGDCMFSGGHNSCKPTNIKHVAKNFKNKKEFKQLLKQAENLEKDKDKTARATQDTLLYNQALKRRVVNEVCKFRKDLNSILDEAEANILSNIENISSVNEKKISMVEMDIESVTSELEEMKKKLDAESNNENALFINAVGCGPQLKRLAKSLDESKSKHVFKKFSFYPDEDLNNLITSAKTLGHLRISRTDKYEETPFTLSRQSGGAMVEDRNKIGLAANDYEDTDCVICIDTCDNPKRLKCGHRFCCECIDQHFKYKPTCPICGIVFGVMTGDQPPGDMKVTINYATECAGYNGGSQIVITYRFLRGTQGPNHPNPGKRYRGFTGKTYLPNNAEGKTLMQMLKVAFDRKLVFTIGCSLITEVEDVIICNGIHPEIEHTPDTLFDLSDPSFLDRLRDELAVKGITEDDIPETPNANYRSF